MGGERDQGRPQRPSAQSLLLTFLGNYVLGRHVAVYSGSFIEIFGRLGVSEHTTRSTLSRMAERGLLARHRRGRRVHFGLTESSERVLRDGEERVWDRGPVYADGDGHWTVLVFSMPESRRRQRHGLRSRLLWAGFGPLGNGTWVAPRRVDVEPLVAGLGIADRIKVFTGRAEGPTDVTAMIRDAYDLDALAEGYREFLARWDRAQPGPELPDDLARYLWVLTEWLRLVRIDPRLPAEHLPAGWPAARAQEVAFALRDRYRRPAGEIAEAVIEAIPVWPLGTRST